VSALRPVIAVIGDGAIDATAPGYAVARRLGRVLVDAGYRIVTGGLGGVMEAASRGARESAVWSPGDVIAVLPGHDTRRANPYVDIALPTGLSTARNSIIAHGDAVVAVGGAAGTLSEMALAWVFDRLIVALRGDGWAGALADRPVDARRRFPTIPDDRVRGAADPEEAVAILGALLPTYREALSERAFM
jgi:uncharacterized protein (TIGR00725 family)